MVLFIINIVILTLNSFGAVSGIKRGESTKQAAFAWFANGMLTIAVLSQILGFLTHLLS